jgi:hypothetical protein
MKTFNHFTVNRRTTLTANVIECDACQLKFKGKRNAPVYLTIAFHINSEYVMGWWMSHRAPGRRSTLRALDASLHSKELGEQTKSVYVISDYIGGQAVKQALHHTGAEVQVCWAAAPSGVSHAERFLRILNQDFNEEANLKSGDTAPAPIGLKKLRKLFEHWLSDYHQSPAIHLSRAQAFARIYSREMPRSHAGEHKPSAAGQPNPAHHRHLPEGKNSRPDTFPFRPSISIRRVRTNLASSSEALYPGHPFQPYNRNRNP